MIVRYLLLLVVISQTALAKPNVWCEVGEWALTSAILTTSFIIDNQPPLLKKTLLGGRTDLPYTEKEAVSDGLVAGASAGFLGGVLLLPNNQGFLTKPSYRNAKGLYEAMTVNSFLTNSAKVIIGRKRPDYDDRLRLGKDTVDGRKAFWSGHASSSFCIATYFSLYTFEHLGDNKKPLVLGAKTLVGLGLHSLATYVAATRITEHKHHASDVIAGALAGSLTSLFFYGLHNDWWGHRRLKTGLYWELLTPTQVRISLTIP